MSENEIQPLNNIIDQATLDDIITFYIDEHLTMSFDRKGQQVLNIKTHLKALNRAVEKRGYEILVRKKDEEQTK